MGHLLRLFGLVRVREVLPRLARLEGDLVRARTDAEAARSEARQAGREAASRDTARAGGRHAEPTTGGSTQPGNPPAIVWELISLSDRLVDLTRAGAPADAEEAWETLRWFAGRATELLALYEIARVEDDGPLDLLRHEVVAGRPAPAAALVEHIAETVRPGYLWRGALLRPQRVVAYVEESQGPVR